MPASPTSAASRPPWAVLKWRAVTAYPLINWEVVKYAPYPPSMVKP
jgi:hypothetical protein